MTRSDALWGVPSLTETIFDLIAGTAPSSPRNRVRMAHVARIGRRLRRREDGLVVRIDQVHRPDRVVEVRAEAPPVPGGAWQQPSRFLVSFAGLRDEYELLVGLKGVKS